MVKHTGLKPYPCPYCPFRTTRREHVSNHVKNKHLDLYIDYIEVARLRKQRYLSTLTSLRTPGVDSFDEELLDMNAPTHEDSATTIDAEGGRHFNNISPHLNINRRDSSATSDNNGHIFP